MPFLILILGGAHLVNESFRTNAVLYDNYQLHGSVASLALWSSLNSYSKEAGIFFILASLRILKK